MLPKAYMQKINTVRPIKDPSKANKKMKYSELVAMATSPGERRRSSRQLLPANGTLGTLNNYYSRRLLHQKAHCLAKPIHRMPGVLMIQ